MVFAPKKRLKPRYIMLLANYRSQNLPIDSGEEAKNDALLFLRYAMGIHNYRRDWADDLLTPQSQRNGDQIKAYIAELCRQPVAAMAFAACPLPVAASDVITPLESDVPTEPKTNIISVSETTFDRKPGDEEPITFNIMHKLEGADSCDGFTLEVWFDSNILECTNIGKSNSTLHGPSDRDPNIVFAVWSVAGGMGAPQAMLIEGIEFKVKDNVPTPTDVISYIEIRIHSQDDGFEPPPDHPVIVTVNIEKEEVLQYPDLEASNGGTLLPNPVAKGNTFRITTGTIENIGDAASGNYTITFYASTSSDFEILFAEENAIDSVPITESLIAGDSTVIVYHLSTASLEVGSYYIGWSITDVDGEINTSNNTAYNPIPVSVTTVEGIVVTTLEDIVDADDGEISLREAIALARPDEYIMFHEKLYGGTIILTGGELVIDRDIVVFAMDTGIAIDANRKSRVMSITTGTTVALAGLTLTGGLTDGNGGGIFNAGELYLYNSTVLSNLDNT